MGGKYLLRFNNVNETSGEGDHIRIVIFQENMQKGWLYSINYFLGRPVKLDNEINSILVIDLIYHVVAVSFNKWYSERLKLLIWYQFLLGVILPLYMMTYILPIRCSCTCITLNNPSISKQSTNKLKRESVLDTQLIYTIQISLINNDSLT